MNYGAFWLLTFLNGDIKGRPLTLLLGNGYPFDSVLIPESFLAGSLLVSAPLLDYKMYTFPVRVSFFGFLREFRPRFIGCPPP